MGEHYVLWLAALGRYIPSATSAPNGTSLWLAVVQSTGRYVGNRPGSNTILVSKMPSILGKFSAGRNATGSHSEVKAMKLSEVYDDYLRSYLLLFS